MMSAAEILYAAGVEETPPGEAHEHRHREEAVTGTAAPLHVASEAQRDQSRGDCREEVRSHGR